MFVAASQMSLQKVNFLKAAENEVNSVDCCIEVGELLLQFRCSGSYQLDKPHQELLLIHESLSTATSASDEGKATRVPDEDSVCVAGCNAGSGAKALVDRQ